MSSSSEDDEEVRETLTRILSKTGTSQIEIPNDPNTDSDSDSAIDVHDWFQKIQEKFSVGNDADTIPNINVLNTRIDDNDDDSDDYDAAETMAAISWRFDQYQNDALKGQSHIFLPETGITNSDVTSRIDSIDVSLDTQKHREHLPNLDSTELLQAGNENCDLSVKALTYSQFPKSAQNFVDALKKNRSCQRYIRKKMIEIEAKIEENKKLKERVKCLMEFQLACKRKIGHILGQKKDPRIKLISAQKLRSTKSEKPYVKFPPLYFGPDENSHVSKYKMVMKKFPVSYAKHVWSNKEKEKLAKGIKQQYQETLLLNSMNMDCDSEDSMNPDVLSSMLSNDEVTPEQLRSFLPLVNWERLASMYLTGRSGAECESRWLNYEDPLINHCPWTMMEDKKLLFIVQERGIYNWIDIATSLGTQRTPFQCLARYQRSLNPHILNKEWTEDEDAKLRAAIEIFGDNEWQLIASTLDGRTGPQCSNRWLKTLNPERRKVGRWSVDEDKRLKVAVMLFGAKNWNKLAQFAPGRTQVQCRERWLNCLDPSLKLEPWTEEEDNKLLAAIEEHGYSWSRVASCVTPRTDNQCMRRWKVLLPHEVPLLQAARQMKQTVLISNFVDRESERPTIGPNDFSSFVNPPDSLCVYNMVTRKRELRGVRKEGEGEGSRDKEIKKPRAKSRKSHKDNSIEVPGSNPNATENGTTKRTRKKRSRERPQKIQKTVFNNDQLDESLDIMLETPNETTTICFTGRRIKKASKNRQSHNQSDNSKARSSRSLEIIPACNTVNSSEVVPVNFSFIPGENGNNDGTAEGISSAHDQVDICADEDVPLICWLNSLASQAKSKRSTKMLSAKDKAVICADEDMPLICWLNSLASQAKSKRSTTMLSAIDQVDICADEDMPLNCWLNSLASKAKSKRSNKMLLSGFNLFSDKTNMCGLT